MKILPWLSFNPDIRLLVFQPRGILDEPSMEKAVAMMEKLEQEADQPFNRYTDLSKLDAIDLSLGFIYRISLHRRRLYENQPPVKSAFYATSEGSLRLARTHLMLTDQSPLQVQIFKDSDGAAQWLGVAPEDLRLEV
jgi:hypothetical protein